MTLPTRPPTSPTGSPPEASPSGDPPCTRRSRIPSPLKVHGGKAPLANRLVALFPPHLHYVEPFAGSLAVLLAKDPQGVSEVVNDLNADLVCFWSVLRCQEDFAHFQRICQATPFSEDIWREARRVLQENAGQDDTFLASDPVRRAWMFFVCCRQSLAGRQASFAPLSRRRTRRGMNEQASAWLSAVEGLPEVHARLKRVVVLNRPALEVIRQQDGPDTLFYIDAPYMHATRSAPRVYANEMTDQDHEELVALLRKVQGKVMVSMYPHPLYDRLYTHDGWRLIQFDRANQAAGGKVKRRMVECLWMNYPEP